MEPTPEQLEKELHSLCPNHAYHGLERTGESGNCANPIHGAIRRLRQAQRNKDAAIAKKYSGGGIAVIILAEGEQ